MPKEFELLTPAAATGVSGDKTGNRTLDRAQMHLTDVHAWANQRMDSRRKDFAKRYAQYRGNMSAFGRDQVQSQLRSQIWIPKSGSLVETVIPRTIGDNPKVEIRGRREEFVEEAYMMERVLDYYLHAMRFFEFLNFWWKDALIYGTGWAKCIWSLREEERRSLDASLGRPHPALQDMVGPPVGYQRSIVEDMPKLVNVDIMDVLFDYTASTVDRMDFVMEKYDLPLDVVVSRLKDGKYTGISEDELMAAAGQRQELVDDSQYKDERDRAAYGYLGNEGDTARHRVDQIKKVTLYDYWGRFDINGDGIDENCLLTAVGPKISKVVRAIRNPYIDGQKPFIMAHYMPVANDALGIGLMEWVEQLQREVNTRYNMGVDNANYMLNQMMLVRRSAGIPDAQLKSRPTGRIDVNEPDDVTPLQMTPIFDKLFAVQGANDQIWMETTGVSSESAGVRKQTGSSFHRTAGGIFALQQAAEARLRMARTIFEERSVKPAIELLISRIKQYMDAPVTVSLAGPEGMQYLQVHPSQIRDAEYDLKVVISPTEQIGRLAEREKWVTTMAFLFKLDPQLMLFEWGNIIHDYMESTGLPNPQRYIGQAAQKLQLMNQLNIIGQMGMQPGAEGGGTSSMVGAQAPGAGGESARSMAKSVMGAGGGQQGGMAETGGESGRSKQ